VKNAYSGGKIILGLEDYIDTGIEVVET